MIKAKFGDRVRSKTPVAMTNEALAKVVCHNICCLILAAHELGIVAEFWGQDWAVCPRQATAVAQVEEMCGAMEWM